MAKRPEYHPNDAMTREQLKQLERSLALPQPVQCERKIPADCGSLPVHGFACAARDAGACDNVESALAVAEIAKDCIRGCREHRLQFGRCNRQASSGETVYYSTKG